jgi:transposase-like protein
MAFMTDGDGASEILKSDKLGCVQVPPERREAILDEFERSGMSGIAFARHHGIKYQTFAAWRKRRKNAPTEAPARKSAFVLVERRLFAKSPFVKSEFFTCTVFTTV